LPRVGKREIDHDNIAAAGHGFLPYFC
jgi:hypothetical protein